ncbi:protein NUCLEAR FUSION DEFECTIVE 4-like [Euphorbia lathyris]|uniref:protein NUCLEAR FUSION DEFECTIVE 4-like n=1 Tax=Euphorbia lathyris TaxID=212925 RepID=UPI003313D13A
MEMEMFNSKWIATVASIWIQCSCGASYTFGIYSSILKSTQDYDQSTLDTVSVFKDIGANAGVISGLLYSAVTLNRNRQRLGVFGAPWVVHAAGAIQCFFGYFMMWASVVGLIPRPPVPVMCLFMWIAAHAQTFFNTSNVVSGVHNFGDYGGTIVGIMKGFLGLSGAMLIQFYDTVCKGNPSTFILVLAVTPTFVSLLFMTLVRNYDTYSKDDKKHLNSFSAIALLIAAYLTINIIVENIFTMPFWLRVLTFSVLILLVVSPLGIALKAQRESSDSYAQSLLEERGYKSNLAVSSNSSTTENPTDYHPLPSGEGGEAKADHGSSSFEDMNLFHAMATVNFWLLFIAMICGLGSGLATINNISQVGESLGYTTIERNSLVALLSIWNFLGRFGAGFVSDIFLHRRGWARPLFMAITQALLATGHIVIASGFSKNLYLGSILIGISYGSQWSLMPTITSEIFGVGHMGTIFNTIAIASPLGSYIFSVRVIGYIYDKAAAGEDKTCVGNRCFMLSFLIMAAVALFGALVALVIFFRTRRFYQQIVLKRLHHS